MPEFFNFPLVRWSVGRKKTGSQLKNIKNGGSRIKK